MFTIFRFTFREAFSRKILLVSIIIAIIFLGLYGTGVHYAVKDIQKANNQMLASIIYPQLLLFGLYFGGFIVSFLAILSSAGLMASDMESGNIQTIVTKPIRRYEVITGKFLGQGVFLAAYAAVMFGVISSVIIIKTGMQFPEIWKAALLFMLQPIVLMSVTLLASVLTSTIASGVIAFLLYSVAVVGGVVEQIGWLIENTTLKNGGIISSLIMPVDSLYRKIVHLMMPSGNPMSALQQMGPFGASAEPSAWMITYTLMYVMAFYLLAVYIFSRKDI
ncbi:MAG: ABC transporter permease [Bacillota bacterium]